MNTVVKFENVCKQYRLGEVGTGTLSHDLHRAWARLRGKPDPFAKVGSENDRTKTRPQSASLSDDVTTAGGVDYVWALKDVAFDVEQGEVLGIIGRNGAGKSTLLKILSRVTAPTSGRIRARGRIASLLEVGTGFHPELTGRENIYLNGAILGMRKHEITRKLDSIIDFSGCERYISTPVKRYSSGMYVRLAFAVAAHLEPEILVVDEVLAVGDAEFQRKCLGKMQDVARGGRTVLFVSHNMVAVQSLCKRALLLAKGTVDYISNDVTSVVTKYMLEASRISKIPLSERADRDGEGGLRITHFGTYNIDGTPQEVSFCGKPVEFRIFYQTHCKTPMNNVVAGIGISSSTGAFLGLLTNQIAANPFSQIPINGFISCKLNRLPLTPGSYTLNLIVRQNDTIQDWIQEAVTLVVEEGDFYGNGRLPPSTHGGLLIEQEWSANV